MKREDLEFDRKYRGEITPDTITFRPLKNRDVASLTPIFRKHGNAISNFLHDYEWAADWNFKTAAKFVTSAVSASHPSYTYLFLKGDVEVVGFGSIGSIGGSNLDVQLVYWVHPDHQGRGVGHTMAATLRDVSLELWGFNSFNYLVAEQNKPSIRVAEKLGLELIDKWSGGEAHARGETGEWRRYCQVRDPLTQQGILQGKKSLGFHMGGGDLTADAIDAILEVNAQGDIEEAQRLARELIDRLDGTEEFIDDRNAYQKALDQRTADIAKRNQQIASTAARALYNKDVQQRKKKKKK